MIVESKLPTSNSVEGGAHLASWLAEAGLELPACLGPRSATGKLSVLLLGSGNEQDVALTVATLLSSSFQNFRVYLPEGLLSAGTETGQWLAGDDRFNENTGSAVHLTAAANVLVLPAGLLLTKYSIEALFEALQDTGGDVVRAVVPGRRQTLEFWNGEFLQTVGYAKAEQSARHAGTERWIDGAGLGLYFAGEPAPKVFFRRGAADRHIVDVNVLRAPPKRARGSRVTLIGIIKTAARRLKALSSRLPRTAAHG